MKISIRGEVGPVTGKETKVGEVYIFDGTQEPYFRHESGLCNLTTGANQPIDDVITGKRFLPTHTELVIG